MTLTLHQHPFASYCWKPLIALYELELPFERVLVGDATDRRRLGELWPLEKIPVLVDDEADLMIPESTVIIEHVNAVAGGGLLGESDAAALQARLWDRILDGFVMTPMQKIVLDHLRPQAERDGYGVEEAHDTLRQSYSLIESQLREREWIAGDFFSLADCAAAPALHYALAVDRWDERELPELTRYFSALVARPSVARVIDEAREFREFFPPGWPDYMQ